MEAERFVELRHQLGRDGADPVADPFDRNSSDLFRLSLRISLQACVT